MLFLLFCREQGAVVQKADAKTQRQYSLELLTPERAYFFFAEKEEVRKGSLVVTEAKFLTA